MSNDPEAKAFTALTTVLDPLDPAGRARVIVWAASRWGVSIAPNRPSPKPSGKAGHPGKGADHDEAPAEATEYSSFGELYDAASPTSDNMRALVGGYWLQVCQDNESFTSQLVNNELKQRGHPVGNITLAFNRLQAQKPNLARQVKKSGKSKQARKTYQLTQAGVERVRGMIGGAVDDGEE